MATWQTRVAAWVIPLVGDFVIPDSAFVFTGVRFGELDEALSPQILTPDLPTAEYPGLIPNFSTDFKIDPSTTGVNYNLIALKAVGFYGVLFEVVSFDEKRLNKWVFPITRRNFGFATLSRNAKVLVGKPLHYGAEYHFVDIVQTLAGVYDQTFSESDLTNDVDKFSMNRVDVFLYPGVTVRVSFLPIWEVWALRFFRSEDEM